MITIVFISTAWGPRHGGVNTLNHDLACAVAGSGAEGLDVRCVVLDAARTEIEEADASGVHLISLGDSGGAFTTAHGYQLKDLALGWGEHIWWVGHDNVSGSLAVAASRMTGARSAVIQHTDYEAYGTLKGTGGDRIFARTREETRTLLSADVVFGVGPKLAHAAADRARSTEAPPLVAELIPGLADISPLSAAPSVFSAITFGRLDSSSNRIKQGVLAVHAFAKLVGEAGDLIGRDPRVTVVGVEADGGPEQGQLQRLAAEKAGRAVPVICTPFTESRDDLFGRLRSASVCLMLSVHEGFGLTGWEAVAAEVPLILSKNSGLYDFLAERFGGPALGCVREVDVEGWPEPPYYTANDVQAVTQALREVARDQARAKRDAHLLKQLVAASCGWEDTANAFLMAIRTGAPVEHGRASSLHKSIDLELLPTSNVPSAADTFVGRQEILEEASRLLLNGPGRLVTLVGPAGTGKTRLAQEIARVLLGRFDEHVYFVDLSSIADPNLVMASITRALRIDVGEPVLEALKELFGGTRVVLILDNFEQVLPAANTLRELIGGAPGLHVIVTSQAPLQVGGEVEVEVPPLSASEAVMLFAQRSSRRLGVVEDEAISRLCGRLDHLPLALELVAASARHYSATDLLNILDGSVLDLEGTRRDIPARHRSLRAAIEWSYSLLTESERRLFCQLAVFKGGWTLLAAAEVLDGGSPPSLQFAREMGALLDKRLVTHDQRDQNRFVMLGTLHEYAAEQLGRDVEGSEVIRGRHASFFVEFSEQMSARFSGAEEAECLQRLEDEQDNLDAALSWLVAAEETESSVRLAVAMGPYWWSRDYAHGFSQLTTVLDLPDVDSATMLQARALFEFGRVGMRLAKFETATEALQNAGRLARMTGDASLEADAGDYLALITVYHGDLDTAEQLLNEALVTHRQHSALSGEADDLDGLGLVAAAGGDGEKAERLLGDSLHIYESLNDGKGAAWVRSDLAQVALILDKPHLSRERANAALAAGRKLKDWGLIGWAQRSLGIAAIMCGQRDEAREALQESLSLFVLLGNQRATVLVLEALARFAAATDRHEEAAHLAAATEAHRRRIRVPRTPADEALSGPWRASSMAVLSPAQRDRAEATGRTMTLEQAVAIARDL